MARILITGATGNIGREVLRFFNTDDPVHEVFAGVRDIDKAKAVFEEQPKLNYVQFDFEKPETFERSLSKIDRLFLIRPPHISDVEKYFDPLVRSMLKQQVNQVVFLSVQGAERSKVIPHNKIERLLMDCGVDYIFLRPSYFMQNLTTTLIGDIRERREIVLPAGKAKFNWVDVENIGESAAILLDKFNEYRNQAFEITGLENESFDTVCSLINDVVEKPIIFRNLNPFAFYRFKKRQGMPKGMIIVMILLHFLPRFQKEPQISHFYQNITGKKPADLKTFIMREKSMLDGIRIK